MKRNQKNFSGKIQKIAKSAASQAAGKSTLLGVHEPKVPAEVEKWLQKKMQ